MTATELPAQPILAALLRASLWMALVLLPALALGHLLLRHRPAARFVLLLGGLLVAAPAPLYLELAARTAGAGSDSWLLQPRGLVRGLLDPAEPAPDRPAAASPPAPAPGRPLDWPAGLLALWLGGTAVCLVRLGHGLLRVHRLRRRAVPWSAPAAAGRYPVLRSSEIAAAAVVGLRRPAILVGSSLASGAEAALEQVLVHEAAHARRRDPLWGLCERLVQAIYWFHPLVALCRRELARAREEACDDPVLARFAPAEYARTLLALAAAPGARTPAAGAAGAHTAVARRIRRLLCSPVPAVGPSRGRLVAALVVLLGVGAWALAVLAPASAAPLPGRPVWVSAGHPSAGSSAAVEPPAREFAAAGPRAQGAFVLQELGGATVVINRPLAQLRLTPASTFKLLIALAGLESGVIPDAHTVFRWNGRPQSMTAWNRDHDLTSAMRTSATWYFEDVLDRLDPGAVQQLLQRLRYGNQDARGSWRRFWIDGPLRISAVEQAEALARVMAGESGASQRSLQLLAEVTELGRDGQGVLYGKTGTAMADGQTVAWLVGGVRRGERGHSYALVMLAPEADGARLQQTRRGITEALLARHGVFGPSR
jgi:bla regulator protein blaR1